MVAPELLARDRGLRRDDRVRAIEQLLHRGALGLLDPVGVEDVERTRGELLQRRLAQGFRRDRPGMDRDAPEAVSALGDGDALAELGCLDGGLLTAGTRADYEKIELHGGSVPEAGSGSWTLGTVSSHMFDSLSEKLQGTLAGVRQRGALTEDDINKAMREIRLALLEADVNFKVVKQFTTLRQGARARDRGHQAAQPGPAGGQDRQRGADRVDGRPVGRHHLLAAPADRDPDGRPAGLGQDDGHGQAGEAAQGAEQVLRRRRRLRRLPARRRRAADQGRRPGGRDRLRAGDRQGPRRHRRLGAGPGQARRQGRPDRRHLRPPARRRGADAGAGEHQEARQAARRAAGRGRDDRPGRGQRRRAVRRGRAVRRRDPLQARRRCARRRRFERQGRHRQADPVRLHGREARRLREVPPRPHVAADPRHGRRPVVHREAPSSRSGRTRPRSSSASSARTSSRSRTSSTSSRRSAAWGR